MFTKVPVRSLTCRGRRKPIGVPAIGCWDRREYQMARSSGDPGSWGKTGSGESLPKRRMTPTYEWRGRDGLTGDTIVVVEASL
jgi:hypothetical protein